MPRPTSARRTGLASALIALAASAALLTQGSCSSKSSPDAGGPLPSTTLSGTIVLPAGVVTPVSGLSVVHALGAGAIASTGTFTLPAYGLRPQLAVVLSPAGHPMLLGWLDATHATLDAQSTAEVLLYFATGMPMQPVELQRQAVTLASTASGLAGVRSAIEAALAADPEAFASDAPAVQQAVAAVVAGLKSSSSSQAASGPTAHRLDVKISQGAQSGATVISDPPYAAHVQNSARRRAWAFVERVGDNSADNSVGCSAASPAYAAVPAADFQVLPVYGLTGGVFQAFTDLFDVAYGNQAAAYGPVDSPSPPFEIPMVEGSTQTCYRVRVAGPGLNAGVQAGLTAAQETQRINVSVQAFAADALLPFLSNAVLGSGLDFSGGQASATGKFAASMLAAFTTDLVAILPGVPGLQDQIAKGQWQTAMFTLFNSAAASAAVQTAFKESFDATAALYKTAELDPGRFATAFGAITKALGVAGGLLQLWDSGTMALDFKDANRADEWDLVVIKPRLTLSPAGPTHVQLGGTVTLTATVLGADDTSGYSYRWTTSGPEAVNRLQQVGGGGQAGVSFCASTNQALYYQAGSTTNQATATVGVTAYAAASCQGTALSAATATLVFDATCGGAVLAADKTCCQDETQAITCCGLTALQDGNACCSDGTQGAKCCGASVCMTGLDLTADDGTACCGGILPGHYVVDTVPTGVWGRIHSGTGVACPPTPDCGVAGLGVGYLSFQLQLAVGPLTGDHADIASGQSFTMPNGVLAPVLPGMFRFVSDTSDNIGTATITSLTLRPDGTRLATFTFTEASSSPSSTRKYSGSGAFIVPK